MKFLIKFYINFYINFVLILNRIETVLQQKKPSRNSANIPNINARLEYTTLPHLDPDLPQPELTADNLHLAGVYKYKYRNIKCKIHK